MYNLDTFGVSIWKQRKLDSEICRKYSRHSRYSRHVKNIYYISNVSQFVWKRSYCKMKYWGVKSPPPCPRINEECWSLCQGCQTMQFCKGAPVSPPVHWWLCPLMTSTYPYIWIAHVTILPARFMLCRANVPDNDWYWVDVIMITLCSVAIKNNNFIVHHKLSIRTLKTSKISY